MTDPSERGSPAERAQAACARWGDGEVVRRCAALLRLGPDAPVAGDGLDLAVVLGGLHDPAWLAGGKAPGNSYWARVWAARALRYVWNDGAGPAVAGALGDEQWRVREMACKVVADREVADTAEQLAELASDDVPRVRKAAVTALGLIGEAEHADAIRTRLGDPDRSVGGAAELALREMSRRLDRPL